MYDITFKPVSNDADWTYWLTIIDQDTGEEVDITSYDFEIEVSQNKTPILTGDTDGGEITFPDDTTIQWSFDADAMGALSEGVYTVAMRVIDGTVTDQLFIASLPVIDGGFNS